MKLVIMLEKGSGCCNRQHIFNLTPSFLFLFVLEIIWTSVSSTVSNTLCGMCHGWGIGVMDITYGTVFKSSFSLWHNKSRSPRVWLQCRKHALHVYFEYFTDIFDNKDKYTEWGGFILFVKGKHFAFTLHPYNNVNGLTGIKKTFLADLHIKQKKIYWFVN